MTHARVVIIGGGIAGCSVAYHLVKLGWRDVVLLERKQLTSGTTWHAAGLIGRLHDLEGGIWIPHDGRVIPADTTQALAAGARAGGARIVEETTVREVLTRDGAVAGVRTSHGEIACDVVVNCAGMWARELGALNGITVPVFP